MTIGPAPMMRIGVNVGAFGHGQARVHHRDEAREQICAVGRAGAGLGVVLHGKRRRAGQAMPSLLPSNRLMCVTVTPSGSDCLVDREAVVLAGDLDLAGGQVLDRLVGAAMAARQLVGPPAQRERQQLMAEADAEQRLAGRQHALDRRHRIGRRSPPDRRGRSTGTRRPAGGAGCPRRSRSPAPPSRGSRRRRGSAGCCAWRRNRPRRRDGAARSAARSPAGQAHAVSSQA